MIIVCALLQGIGFSPAAAQSPEPEQDFAIYLAQNTFDPLQALPEVPQSLTYSPAEVEANGVYIVQFVGPIEDAWKEQVTRAGGLLGPYIPNYAFLVKMDPTALSAVRAMPEVRWVGPYEAAYKLAARVTPAGTRTYRVILAPWASDQQAAREVSAFAVKPVVNHTQPLDETMDATVSEPGAKVLAADLDSAGLYQAARLGDVLWIEPVYLNKLHNNIGGAIIGGVTAWNNGYTGTGQSINVTDSGIDTGAAVNIHPDFRYRVANIASWPVVYADYGDGCVIQNPGANDGASDGNGHGTHVTGSVAGNGAASAGAIKGLAHTSIINFQAVEQYTVFPPTCSDSSGYYLTGIPLNLAPMFDQAYIWGARIQNESWGGGNFGEYDDQAAQFDSYIASHQDFAVFVAAGNAGTDVAENYGLGDGYVDENSISSPATAKNVITIGASDNERVTGGLATDPAKDYWSYWWGWDYYNPPTGNDKTSDNHQELAAFSSRGPMLDGRIKPDLVAPGTNILSTRSSLETSGGWGSYNLFYHYMGGTSMASPLAAGAGTLVRQYYVTRENLTNPSAALIKATLINTATDITGYGNTTQEAGKPIPNNHEGWGLINVGAATTPGKQFVDHPTGVSTGATQTYWYNVGVGQPLKISLAWSDPAASPLASVTLVNNLNLRVTAPDGTTTYLGNVFSGGWSATGGGADTRNNVENVYINNPTAGAWKVEVIGQNVPAGPQRFALVVNARFAPSSFSKSFPATGNTIPVTRTTLSWAASQYASSYEYCYDTTNNATCEGTWTSTGTSRQAFIQGLADNTTYYWHVRALNAAGTTYSNTNAIWSFTVDVISLPARNYLPFTLQ